MAPVFTLFLIIFLEGYVVLSTELLAIRLLIPFTGSGTDTVSIIIAAILMPLAFGYYAGGKFLARKKPGGKTFTVRDRLVLNLVIAAAILTPGLSHAFLESAFNVAYHKFGWNNRIWLTSVYSALFLVWPVFLLGQTVPLVSNYFSRGRLPVMAGKILFFSTMGSFMGAIFCTLVLMTWLGVHNAVIVTVGCMALLVFVLARKKVSPPTAVVSACLALCILLNSGIAMRQSGIVGNNKYNLIQIEDYEDGITTVMKLNRTYASAVYKDRLDQRLLYVNYIEKVFIEPLYADNSLPPRDILILGAGGFTMGRVDDHNNYTFVDIDGDLKEISEKHLLKEELGPNKRFEAVEARAFLNQTRAQYDLIILDLYRDPVSAPEYLITREFYRQVKDHLKEGGAVVGNYFASPTFADPFSVKLDNTLRAVFPNIGRTPLKPYDAWNRKDDWMNIIYSYIDAPARPEGIYTDDRNTSPFEKPVTVHAGPKNDGKK